MILCGFSTGICCIITTAKTILSKFLTREANMETSAAKVKIPDGETIFSKKVYDAVLFDLDGVITTTEKIHCACWKKTFDEFLSARASKSGEKFIPFSETDDYLEHVDGKPRYEGVRSFLVSRGIELPEGKGNSPPGEQSVFGLGNKKNQLFGETLEKESPGVYEASIALVRRLKQAGFRLAVVSSSRNCRAVMAAAGIENLFEVTVDGVTADEKNLRGKPEPDTFIEAASVLGSEPQKSIVIEDAAAGVAAGASGGFGLVIGVARKRNEDELLLNGADVVVSDLGELGFGE